MNRLLVGLLIALPVLAAAGLLWYGPITQEQGYHAFADRRAWGGIPNGADVFSNLPFLLIGAVGLWQVRRWRGAVLQPAYFVFFLGTALTAFGSGYYHLAPDDATLFWDRLPMTLIFAAFISPSSPENASGPGLERGCSGRWWRSGWARWWLGV